MVAPLWSIIDKGNRSAFCVPRSTFRVVKRMENGGSLWSIIVEGDHTTFLVSS